MITSSYYKGGTGGIPYQTTTSMSSTICMLLLTLVPKLLKNWFIGWLWFFHFILAPIITIWEESNVYIRLGRIYSVVWQEIVLMWEMHFYSQAIHLFTADISSPSLNLVLFFALPIFFITSWTNIHKYIVLLRVKRICPGPVSV